MHCASCAATVRRAIEARPGVRSAAVSVTDGTATIHGTDLQAEALVQAVRDRGFDAEPGAEAVAPDELRSEIEIRQTRRERQWRFRAIVGLGLWVPMALLHWFGPLAWDPWTPWVLLAAASLPFALRPALAVLRETAGPPLNAALRGTARLHLLFSVLLALGIAL